ncbi:SAM-dependent chlorinase/fluorinase [Oscillatoria sp. CS-180]|uniref:SAM hydrolase/SAM-dependent halogenase family protein n=1 Tax=Oscillatoria sp. CS-180 TaxID=3021720 RepID=UPI00232F176F|nr:SAM-dependent chlorinase/fluorinase [Oscillatoria sp. CS-180]MDB9528368.1 SAM-dependent chlorinase/fluorinase [Oscillatoria sp. CS-180]
MAPLITLLTDFGYQDGYVGVMKGVILSICSDVRLVDLSHAIPSQHIAAARFTLLNAYAYFPKETIHVVVVDPGVGTARRAIALQTPYGYLIGPDNGVLSGVTDQVGILKAVSLTQSAYWRVPEPSRTFHGRDIFAPVAAHLAMGVSLSDLGEAIDPISVTRIDVPQPRKTENAIVGHVQHIDGFGNLITTIPERMAQHQHGGSRVMVGAVDMPFGLTYGDVEIGHAIALIGSHGWVEIAVNGSSAQARLRLAIGDEIQLCLSP